MHGNKLLIMKKCIIVNLNISCNPLILIIVSKSLTINMEICTLIDLNLHINLNFILLYIQNKIMRS